MKENWVDAAGFSAILLCLLVAGCSAGGIGGVSSVQPPSNLTYPQTSISATVGTAIASDTPTVSGSVNAFSVSPALPAGLLLNMANGMISGTPTAESPQATYAVTASNSGGSTTAILTIVVALAPPAKLVYPQISITAKVGTAIAPDTPTVTGTAVSYSVSPALPAGLTVNAMTGTISGTPTAGSAQATYTVTATNSAGSTTAALSITVLAAPSQLVYPQSAIYATVGFPISADVPSVFGTATSFSVAPALPAGMALDPASGTIAGTPTAPSPKTSYTVTASDTVGSTTAQINITVATAPSVLVDLGHVAPVIQVEIGSDRLLSLDSFGRWLFWEYSSAKILASGDGAQGLLSSPANLGKMVGDFFAVSTGTQIQLYSSTDGHSLVSIPFSVAQGQGWAQIATDGSYLCTGTASALTVWSPQGQSELTIAGDYHAAMVYAAPGQVQIADGSAGVNVIQTVSVPSGTVSASPQFSGTFNSWFLDGQSFFTSVSNKVRIYSSAATQEAYLTNLPSSQGLTGNGSLFWQGTSVYSVSTGTLIQQYPTVTASGTPSYWSSGTTMLVAFSAGSPSAPEVQIVDLSGVAPNATIQPIPVGLSASILPVFAAQDPQAWILAGPVVLDGVSLSTSNSRYFGYGQPSSLAAGPISLAISTATGIHLFEPGTAVNIGDFGFNDGFGALGGFVPLNMQLSTDGSVLAAYESFGGPPPTPTLNVYSLPAASMVGSFTYPQSLVHPSLLSFNLSGSGTALGQVIDEGFGFTSPGPFTRQVTGISGTPTIWSDSGGGALVLSPDGTLIAATNEPTPTDGNGVTSLYRNGALVTTVAGYAEGWIDNNRLLTSNFSIAMTPTYLTSTIYSATGQMLFTFESGTLPQIMNPQFTSTNSVYDRASNTVYSLADGSITWRGPALNPPSGAVFGALAGPYVAFIYGHQVFLAPY